MYYVRKCFEMYNKICNYYTFLIYLLHMGLFPLYFLGKWVCQQCVQDGGQTMTVNKAYHCIPGKPTCTVDYQLTQYMTNWGDMAV